MDEEEQPDSLTHTPGPWECVDGRDRVYGLIFVKAPNAIVKNNRGPSYAREILEDTPYPEKLADAKLIALAPDMHAAIVEFCRRVDAGEVRSKKTYEAFSAILEKLT